MTMTSLTEQKIRDHRRNAALHEEFARAADEDGKVYMGELYRNISRGHLQAVERLEGMLKKMRDDDKSSRGATVPQSANVLDLGRGCVTDRQA